MARLRCHQSPSIRVLDDLACTAAMWYSVRMDFGDIRSSVYQLWQFAWPPLIFGVAMSATIMASYRRLGDAIWNATTSRMGSDPSKNKLRGLLTSIGAAKLYPGALGILIIFAFMLINEWIYFWQWLPPTLVTMPSSFRLSYMSKSDQLDLFQLYPYSSSLREAFSMAYDSFPPDVSRGERYSFYFHMQTLCKATSATALLLFLSVIWTSKTRLRAFFYNPPAPRRSPH